MEKPISSKIVFDCPVFRVEETIVELPDGSNAQRWFVISPDAALVIPVDADDNILLIREWRAAANRKVLKLVAGKVDEGEEPLATAQRELREEIGFAARSLELFLEIPTFGAWLKQNKYFYVARDLYVAPLDSGDEWEKPDLVSTAPDEVLRLIDAGEIQGDIAVALRRFILKK